MDSALSGVPWPSRPLPGGGSVHAREEPEAEVGRDPRLMLDADRCMRLMLNVAETSMPTPYFLRIGSWGAARVPLARDAALADRLSELALQLGMNIAGSPVATWMAVVM